VRRHARVVIRRRGQWLLAGAQPDFTIVTTLRKLLRHGGP
jgi:hypothetical protein